MKRRIDMNWENVFIIILLAIFIIAIFKSIEYSVESGTEKALEKFFNKKEIKK